MTTNTKVFGYYEVDHVLILSLLMEQDEWWTVVIQFCGIQGSKTFHLDWNSKGFSYIV